jgi:uncharacterized membrane protein
MTNSELNKDLLSIAFDLAAEKEQDARRMRREAIAACREAGMTWREMAKALDRNVSNLYNTYGRGAKAKEES